MTSERMASSLARPPALRITWASPSARPAYFAGSRRASIQVRIAKRRLGGSGRLPLSPKFSAYLAFAATTSSRILVIALASCSELSQRIGYQENKWGAERVTPTETEHAATLRFARRNAPPSYWFTVVKNCVTSERTRSLRKNVSVWPRPGTEKK